MQVFAGAVQIRGVGVESEGGAKIAGWSGVGLVGVRGSMDWVRGWSQGRVGRGWVRGWVELLMTYIDLHNYYLEPNIWVLWTLMGVGSS